MLQLSSKGAVLMAKKKIYTVATSHLDTIWSWDFETTVSKYIYDTLVDNFALFKKYPHYTFSFEGSYRYELMEEYYPELFKELKGYIADGRWNVTGSAFENGDVNCPSPEALFRNILIGNTYFDEKFSKRSKDIFLPDCFGFGYALPSVAHHAHLTGFTTQKLAWGSAYGVPFDIGKWYGVDGNFIYASLNPHDYYFTLTKLRDWDFVQNKLAENEKIGLDMTYIFHGIGDRGGAPQEESVRFVENAIAKNDASDIEVLATSADQIYRDIESSLDQSVKDKLPVWDNELVMQNHGVGGYTSRAIGKRWNAKCQNLADIAERSGVEAEYYGTANYNACVLETAWKRAIAHQFHDDTPGTSVQRAYKRSWNDYAMSINQISGEIEHACGGLSSLMKSDFCSGTPIMVYNSVEADRTGAVTARIKTHLQYLRVFDDKGREVPSQIINKRGDETEVLFVASLPSLGARVYDVRNANEACRVKSTLKITDTELENEKYVVTVNRAGNISSIVDKSDDDRELLKKPIVLGLFNYTGSKEWPAWEMNFKEADKEPDRTPKIVSIEKAEVGPARVAFKITQKDKKSTFVSYICLTAQSEIVEVYNEIEWQLLRTMCKNVFSFTASNEKATFDLGLGAIKRGNMSEKLFEVPAQKWADLTDDGGDFGVSVISDSKHGWDKFNDNTLRLTVLHTPKRNYRIDSMQSMLDLGLNRYGFAIYSHKGALGSGTELQSRFFTQPMTATLMTRHTGALGSSCSFGSVSTSDVSVRCIKKAYHKNNDEIIVRFNEVAGRAAKGFEFTLGEGIDSACEVWASEEYKGNAEVKDGTLICDFTPYEVKTFKLLLKKPKITAQKSVCTAIDLDYSTKNTHIPQNLLPKQITVGDAEFKITQNRLARCNGQTISLDKGESVKFLVASLGGDKDCIFTVGGSDEHIKINAIDESYAGWDLYDLGETAFVKGGRLGFEFTHSVDDDGNTLFAKGLYFWLISFDETVILPDDPDIVILGAVKTAANGTKLLTPLEDEVENHRQMTFKMNFVEKLRYFNSKMVWNLHDKDNFLSHWNNGKNGKRVEQTGKRIKTRTVETVGH